MAKATKPKPIKVKYILNPGDGKDVIVEVCELSARVIVEVCELSARRDGEWLAKFEDMHKIDPTSNIYRVTYAGRRLIFEHYFYPTDAWEILEPEERTQIPNKVLEHIR